MAWRRVLSRARRLRNPHAWRGYALTVLVVLTVVAVIDGGRTLGWEQPEAASPVAADSGDPEQPRRPLIPNPVPDGRFPPGKPAAELPPGGRFTVTGAGTWSVVPGAGSEFGTGRLFTYTVEVEDGVRLAGGPRGFATTVDATLHDPRSWVGSGKYAFRRVDRPRRADIRISLASQRTARRLCGFAIPYDASCWKAEDDRVVINTARWVRGAVSFEGNIVAYQQYVINHEVGHALGFSHLPCPRDGALAPVMMQQTWGVSNNYLAKLGAEVPRRDGAVCEANAWPFPTGADSRGRSRGEDTAARPR